MNIFARFWGNHCSDPVSSFLHQNFVFLGHYQKQISIYNDSYLQVGVKVQAVSSSDIADVNAISIILIQYIVLKPP
jgi:hypothetical protein